MYSYFVLAEPANLVINATSEMFKDIGIHFDKPCTLEELGTSISGWKIFGYLNDNYTKTNYRRIIEEIHNQHPNIDFKLHYWYEENIMFYFCWNDSAIIKYGNRNDCTYFVNENIINNISGIFNKKSYLLDVFSHKKINNVENARKISNKIKNDDNILLYVPNYFKFCEYFQIKKL